MDRDSHGDPSRRSSKDHEQAISHDSRQNSAHASAASSRRSSTVHTKPRKHASNASLEPGPTPSEKSLTSFPSLSPSPENSPQKIRADPIKAAILQASQPQASKITPTRPSIVDALVASTPSARNRSALFDDTPTDTRGIPGTLHHASDDHIRRLLAKNGAVALVRQLAEDLAQRDAQITELRRRAEERERLLRKMLKECQVTNLDIETRLRELEARRVSESGTEYGIRVARSRRNSRNGSESICTDDSMAARMNEAMSDGVGLGELEDLAPPASSRQTLDNDATVRAKGKAATNAENGLSIGADLGYDIGASGAKVKGIGDYFSSSDKRGTRATSIATSGEVEHVPHQRVRADGAVAARRRGLDGSTFQPPLPPPHRSVSGTADLRANPTRLQASADVIAERPRKASGSVASWAMKLIAGSTQNSSEASKQSTARGRAATVSSVVNGASRPASIGSFKATTSAAKGTISKTARQPRPSYSTAIGSVMSTSPVTLRSAASSIMAPTSPQEDTSQSEANLGPVEMDTILPREVRPPTLLQQHNLTNSSDFLTDRFGFIYDQRRKKRQAETAAALPSGRRSSNMEPLDSSGNMLGPAEDDEDGIESLGDGQSSKPDGSRPETPTSFDRSDDVQATKRWQDYLKLATFPTELLSHTPSVAPIATPQADAEVQATKVTVEKRPSLPTHSANPKPTATNVSSNNAEFAQLSDVSLMAPASTPREADPVKSLLSQVTALHDTLQRQKEARWNEFFRRVRAARQREGEGAATSEGRRKFSSMPEVLLTDGEMIGVSGLGNKGRVGRAKWKEFRSLVLGGIPVAYRPKVWAECSGANGLRIPQYYDDLVHSGEDDPEIVNQIQMDITRTLTDNIFFRKGAGVPKLQEVLLAYSRRNPEVGYCQGMNLITACLLLIMPTAEDAFWVLASMVENILPQDYYNNTLLAAQADQKVLIQYVAEILPKLFAHFEALGIELEALTFQWFLSVFTDCLSAEALFRVWDVVLCLNDGSTFLFQVAVALLKLNERNLLRCDNPAAVYHYINHEMTNHAISIDGLIGASEALRKVIRAEEAEERRKKAVEKEREIARQRAEIRAGKGRERVMEDVIEEVVGPGQDLPKSRPSEELQREESERYGVIIDEFGNEQFGELQVRTPMPIEEEAQWRA